MFIISPQKAKGPLYEVCQFKEESAFGSLEQSLRS